MTLEYVSERSRKRVRRFHDVHILLEGGRRKRGWEWRQWVHQKSIKKMETGGRTRDRTSSEKNWGRGTREEGEEEQKEEKDDRKTEWLRCIGFGGFPPDGFHLISRLLVPPACRPWTVRGRQTESKMRVTGRRRERGCWEAGKGKRVRWGGSRKERKKIHTYFAGNKWKEKDGCVMLGRKDVIQSGLFSLVFSTLPHVSFFRLWL